MVRKICFALLVFIPTLLIAQTQIGQSIVGEAVSDQSGRSVSLSADGSIVAIGAPDNDGNGNASGHVRIYQYDTNTTSWVQLGADIDGEAAGDESGYSVSLSADGTRVAIGGYKHNSYAGQVRVFEYNTNTDSWSQLGANINGEAAGDEFGKSVSLSADGTRLAIGAPFNDGNGLAAGHARVYEYDSSNWIQLGSDIDGEVADDICGSSVSISADGSRVAIGAPNNDGNGGNSGHVRVYEYNTNTTSWTKLGDDIDGLGNTNYSGASVSLSNNGNLLAIGAYGGTANGGYSGYVQVFEFNGSSWEKKGADINGDVASEQLGTSVSLSNNGSRVAVGAPTSNNNGINSGYVRLFEYVSGAWTQVLSDINGEAAGDNFGSVVALSGDGSRVAGGSIVNSTGAGHVRVYSMLIPPPSNLNYADSPINLTYGTAMTVAQPTVDGTVASYSINPALPAGLSFNTTNGYISGTPTEVSTATDYTITATNSQGSDNTTVNITVGKATLTAKADNASREYGESNPVFTVGYTGFVLGENASVIDTPSTASTVATVTTGTGAYDIDVNNDGLDDNYNIVADTQKGQLTITQANLIAKAIDVSREYGEPNPAFTVGYTGFKNSEDASVINNPPTTNTIATETSGVGQYDINVNNDGSDNNYNIVVDTEEGLLTITKATLTAKADNASREYGEPNPAFTVGYTGFKNSEDASVIDTPSTASTTATVSSNVGDYDIDVNNDGSDNNYNIVADTQKGQLTITKATLTAKADNASREYGETNPALVVGYTGFKNSEDASVIDTPSTANTIATVTSNVGDYDIDVNNDGVDNNYTIVVDTQKGQLTITKATLTAKANNASREYGASNPTFTVGYTGFKNSEDASVIDTPSTASTIATVTSNVGDHDIDVANDGSDNNYTIVADTQKGQLTITKATVTARAADNQSRIYGDPDPVFLVEYTGLLNGEEASVIDSDPTGYTSSTLSSPVGQYDITLNNDGLDNNYIINVDNTSPRGLAVHPASLIAKANNASRKYGASNPIFIVGYTGFKNGEDASVIGTPPTATTTATETSDVGSYDIDVNNDGVDDNYTIVADTQKGQLTITQASQTITFNSLASVHVGDAPFALTGTSSSGLTVSYTSSDPAVATVSGSTVTIVGQGSTDITASQPGNINYTAATPVVQALVVDYTLGEQEDTLAFDSVKLYPNPAKEELHIVFKQDFRGKEVSVLVYDLIGKLVMNQNQELSEDTISLNTSGLPSGVYLVEIGIDQRGLIKRLIKE